MTIEPSFAPLSQQHHFSKAELMQCGKGLMFGEGNAQLPTGAMLMLDRITNIFQDKGLYNKGYVEAELDINSDLWFFQCHFHQDPVMPGCLGLDAMWQLLGFFLGWLKYPGRGRALGVEEVKFTGQVQPEAKLVRYRLDINRVITRKLIMGIADGLMSVDGKTIYQAKNLRVGLFTASQLV